MKAIFSMSSDGAISNLDNPYSLIINSKEELNHFRRMTSGGVVIMGANTFETLNRTPLPDRRNIVLSQTAIYDGVESFGSIDAMLPALKGEDAVWVIGGGQTIQHLLPYISEFVITIWDFDAKSLIPSDKLIMLGSKTQLAIKRASAHRKINTIYATAPELNIPDAIKGDIVVVDNDLYDPTLLCDLTS